MATYLTIKNYGVSKYLDVTGVPLLTWKNPTTGVVITCFDRVAVQIDPTLKQVVDLSKIDGGRMDVTTSAALKKAVGGTSAQELDHIISLELGGSNQLANLGLDPGTQGTVINPTDTYENQLAAAVQSGAMTLLDSWRAIATAKGKLLAEDMTMTTDSSWATAASTALGAAWNALTGAHRGTLNTNLQAQIKQDFDTLAANPYDINMRKQIFTEQINLTAEQLNLSTADAAAYTKVYTVKYAQSKGQNPTEMTAALEAGLQQMLGLAGKTPNLLGIANTVWANVAAACAAGAGIVATVGAVGFIAAMFLGAPAEAGAAAAGSGVAAFLSLMGVNATAIGVLATTELVAGALLGISFIIPMITKQALDAGFIAPSLTATGLKDYVALLKGQGVSTGSTSSTPAASPAVFAPSGSGASASSVSGTGVHVSVVSGGVLGSPATFTPSTSDIFESAAEVQAAAEENIAKYIAGLAGSLAYRLRLVSSIVLADGTVRIGTKQRVQVGTTKKGVPTYKNVTNQFVVADISYTKLNKSRVKLDEIVIGAVDETGTRPTAENLAAMSDAISAYLVQNHLGGVTQVNIPATTTLPAVTPTAIAALSPTATTQYNSLVAAGASPATALNAAQQIPAPTPAPVATPVAIPVQNAAQASVAAAPAPVYTPPPVAAPTPAPVLTVKQKQAAATNLYEFYAASGTPLPSVAVEAQTYFGLGLGTAASYVGSAGQNTTLLNKLKILTA